MKLNIILFFVLIGILSGIYFSEEVYKKDVLEKESIEQSLIQSEKILSLEFANGSIEFAGDFWVSKNIQWPLNQGSVDYILKLVKGIKVLQKISGKDFNEFFRKNRQSFSVQTPEGVFHFDLGDSAEATGNFYILNKEKNEVYLCEDTTALNTAFSSDRDLGLKKYLRLVEFVNRGVDLFWESNFLKAMGISEVSQAMIDSVRNRPLEIDFIKRETKPAAPSPLSYKDLNSVFSRYFAEINIIKLIDKGQNYLTDQRSVVTLDGNQKLKLTYYSAMNDSYGKFIRVDGIDYIFQVDMDEQNIFFLSGKDFWNKRFHYPKSINNLTSLDFALSFDQKAYYDFQVYDLENFKIRATSDKVSFSKVHMNVLFNLLLNLVDFKEAMFVETFHHFDNPERSRLWINFLGSTMVVWIEDNVIKVLDKNNGLLYYFADQSGQLTEGFFGQIFTVN